MDNNNKEKFHENYIEGRNAVLEAFRSGKTIDKLFVLDGCQDGPIKSITREARKHDAIINYVAKERLDQMSETGKHQGVIAVSAAYEYAEVSDKNLIYGSSGSSCLMYQIDENQLWFFFTADGVFQSTVMCNAGKFIFNI